MDVPSIIEGLQIIQRCKPEMENDFHFRAEHDQIFVGSLKWLMCDADKFRLKQLGWMPDEGADGWVANI